MTGEPTLSTTNETFAVLLTGAGRGAVASIMLRGPSADSIIGDRFRKVAGTNRPLLFNKPHFGTWCWQDYSEELVVCRTDTDAFEIHCHGGDAASAVIMKSLQANGAKLCSTSDWLASSVPDPFVRHAKALLPTARTPRLAALLLDQTRGTLRTQLNRIREWLHDGATDPDKLQLARNSIDRLVQLGKIGVRIGKPFSIVLIGPPNTGKSSLINALVGFERSVVFDQPGTTRDLVRTDTAIDGWAVSLVDTAGVRASGDIVEQKGVQLAQRIVQDADLAIVVHDLHAASCAKSCTSPSLEDFGLLPDQPSLTVGTKADLLVDAKVRDNFLQTCDLVTSAETGEGIESLLTAMIDQLVPIAPLPGEALPLDQASLSALANIAKCIEAGSAASTEAALAIIATSDILRLTAHSVCSRRIYSIRHPDCGGY